MPAARLKPLPFPEPSRLLDLVEQDPSLVEPGFRLVARRVPLPPRGGGIVLDALASDASGRCVLLRAIEKLTPRGIEEILTARAWITENLPTLKALCPQLGVGAGETRCLVLASEIEEPTESLLSLLAGASVEIVEVHAFDSPSGLALSVRALAPHAKKRPVDAPASTGAEERRSNPLAGIPLTADEVAEFRKLVSSPPQTQRAAFTAEQRPSTAYHPATDLRGAFLEN